MVTESWLFAPVGLFAVLCIPIVLDVFGRRSSRRSARLIASAFAIAALVLCGFVAFSEGEFRAYMNSDILNGEVLIQILKIAFLILLFALPLSYLTSQFKWCNGAAKFSGIVLAAISVIYFALEKNSTEVKDAQAGLVADIESAYGSIRVLSQLIDGAVCGKVVFEVPDDATATKLLSACRKLRDEIIEPSASERAVGESGSLADINIAFLNEFSSFDEIIRQELVEPLKSNIELIRSSGKALEGLEPDIEATKGFDQYLYTFILLFIISAVLEIAAFLNIERVFLMSRTGCLRFFSDPRAFFKETRIAVVSLLGPSR